jgi:hypothetical protein
MIAGKCGPAQIIKEGGKSAEEVSKFCYLRSIIVKDGFCDKEIKARLGEANATFGRLNIW